MTRLLVLYLRCRQVPVALPAAVVAAGVLARLGSDANDPLRTLRFALLAAALGVAVLGYGLGGAMTALESTASIRWPRWRAAHVVAIAAVLIVTVAVVTDAPIAVVARDTAGLTGLTALAAAAFGSQLAWTPPVVWACVAAVVPPVATPAVLSALTWPAQPAASVSAAVVATVLAGIGVVVYATRGGRP
jgi:hypothetical protein